MDRIGQHRPLFISLVEFIKGTGKSGQNRDFDHFSRPLFISLVEFIKGTGKSGQNRDCGTFRPLEYAVQLEILDL